MIVQGTSLEERVVREILQQYETEHYFPGFNQITIQNKDKTVLVSTDDNFNLTLPIPDNFNILTDEKERIVLYEFFRRYFGFDLDWGILSGVKPVKLYRKIERLGYNPDQILTEVFSLKPEKVQLLKEINALQKPILDSYSGNKHISLYLGIPICPQKCSYCSFVSTILDKKRSLLTTYLVGINEEIKRTAELVNNRGLIIDSVYIGGGTPSVLLPDEADSLLKLLNNEFNLNSVREFTFETGRPETTSLELLDVLESHQIDRICLNPQTMNQQTLYAVNRNHTVDEFINTYSLIKQKNFNSVNMDLIVGLNNEPEASFLHSLNEVLKLRPDNLTVHDLSIKKGSYLNEINGKDVNNSYNKEFFRDIRERLNSESYKPYYLYRQKYTIGNGENVGYTLPGKESLYNILMMAEEQTIIGIGAGSSGKLYQRELDRFSHVFTVKDVRTYNSRTDEIINKKLTEYANFFKIVS